MAINITNNTGTIEVQITTVYTTDGVTISPQTYYFNKGEVSVSAQGNNVIISDDSRCYNFLYSDITTPSGASADDVAASIQAFLT